MSNLAPGVTVGDLGETTLINRIRRRVPTAPAWVSTGIGDDAAVVEPTRGTLDVITTDTLVEGIHFDRSFVSAVDVGHKSLAVNLSDLAAMGATPRVAVLSLVLPASLEAIELDQLIDGLLRLAGRHKVSLVGGNITSTRGPLVVGMTAVGSVRRRRVITRTGGRPGDELWITGTIGAAAAGLGYLQQDWTSSHEETDEIRRCIERYRRPEPQVRIGTLLGRNRVARAGVDLSDGLADGLRQITRASGTGAVIDGQLVPLEPAATRWFSSQGLDPLVAGIASGDDYELLIAVPRNNRRRLESVSRLSRGVPLTRIGELIQPPDLVLRTQAQDRALPVGYQHFRQLTI